MTDGVQPREPDRGKWNPGAGMKKLLVAASLLLSASAWASGGGCIVGPKVSVDKTLHFVGTAAIASTVTVATTNPWYGFGAGMLAGAAREGYKIYTPGMRCEWSSIAYDLAGSASGAYFAHWYITPVRGGVYVAYHRDF